MKAIRDDARYRAHIQSPEWRAFRAEVIKARGGKCEICPSWSRLQVHHLTYERLGAELPGDVLVVCQECHEALHGRFDAATTRVRKERAALVEKYRASVREARQQQAEADRKARVKMRVAQWMKGEAQTGEKKPVRSGAVRRRPAATVAANPGGGRAVA